MTKKEYYNMIEMAKVTPVICDAYLKSKEQFFGPILEHYKVDVSAVRMELRKELCAAGIAVREMDLAVHFLIENCAERGDECSESLHEEVTKCILYSGIYFANILPGIVSGEGVSGVISPQEAQQIRNGIGYGQQAVTTAAVTAEEYSALMDASAGVAESNNDNKTEEAPAEVVPGGDRYEGTF